MKFRVLMASAMLSLPAVSHGQVQEVWQTRLLKGMQKLQTQQRAHKASIEQLKFDTEAATNQAKTATQQMKSANRAAERVCNAEPNTPACQQARVVKSDARLGLIEAGVGRLKTLAAIVRQHHTHALGSAEQVHKLVRAIERDTKAGRKGGPKVEAVAARVGRYVGQAIVQLESLPASRTQRRERGAALAKLRAMQRLARGPQGHRATQAPIERLRNLQAQLELVATLSTQAEKALTERALRLRTETTIGGIQDLMQVGGTVKETYIDYSKTLDVGLASMDEELLVLQDVSGDLQADDEPGAVFEEMEPPIF